MPELKEDSSEKEGWVYVGRKKSGEAKFRKYTNQTLEHVTAYLDSKELTYFVYEDQCLIFIYKVKEPKKKHSPRYSYYYTTGQWGGTSRRKHYHSDGIEHFVEKYYKTYDEEKAYWDAKEGEDT